MRYQAVRIHAQSGRARDHEWVMLVTEFLRTYTADLSRELLTQAVDMKSYLSKLTEQLKAASSRLESGSPQRCHGKRELINLLRCADRRPPRIHNRDTQARRTTNWNRGRMSA